MAVPFTEVHCCSKTTLIGHKKWKTTSDSSSATSISLQSNLTKVSLALKSLLEVGAANAIEISVRENYYANSMENSGE